METREPATRGRKFTGPIKSTKMARTAVFEIERRHFLAKYERYEKRATRIKAHIPVGMEVADGDIVTIHETRPISKTKHFLIVRNHTQGLVFKNGNIEKEKEKPENY